MASDTDRRSPIQNIVSYLVIAAISAGATGYVTVSRVEERVAALSARMDRMESVQEHRYVSLQEDLRRIYILIDTHRRATP